MFTLPPGISVSDIVQQYVDLAEPFIAVFALIAAFKIIMKVLKKS